MSAVSSCPPAASSSAHDDNVAASTEAATTTTTRSSWRRRRSQKGKPRFRLAKHPTRRAMLVKQRSAQRAIAAAEKAARGKAQRAFAAAAKAARRKQKAVEKAARREREAVERAAMREQKAVVAAASQKKRKAAAAVVGRGSVAMPAARRRLDVDGEQQMPPTERIYETYSSSRADLIDNMRFLVALDLASPPATSESHISPLPPPPTTAIVALNDVIGQTKKTTKKATTVNKLVLVPYKPKRSAASPATTGADEVLPGALVLYGGPTTTPRVYVPRWTSVRLVLDKLPPRFSLVVGLDTPTKAVYKELVRREETSYGDDELKDVPGGPEWDERRRENFSPWGGSVVTSVVGTFLTQNVTDNLSSNAFMTIAARFPLKSRRNAAHNSDNVPLLVAQNSGNVPLLLTDDHDEQEQYHCQLQRTPPCSSGVPLLAQNSGNVHLLLTDGHDEQEQCGQLQRIAPCSSGLKSSVAEPGDASQQAEQTECPDKDLEAIMSAIRSGDISNWDDDHIQKVLKVRFKDSTPPPPPSESYSSNRKTSSTAETIFKDIMSIKKNDTSHWHSLYDEARNRGYIRDDDIPDMVDWEALMNASFADVVDCIKDRGQHSQMAFRILCTNRYELHCQMITFGKAICRKSKPNCGACPFTSECKYYKSQFGRAALALPEYSQQDATKEADMDDPTKIYDLILKTSSNVMHQYQIENGKTTERNYCEPVIEIPPTPLHEYPGDTSDEDDENEFYFNDDMEDIAHNYDMEIDLRSAKPTTDTSQAEATPGKEMISINPQAQSTPMVKKFSLRTEYTACIIPDGHIILKKFDPRVPGDRNPYLLIPSRTANQGMFPLNGTYFQENEVFADHSSSRSPIEINRDVVWELQRRTCTVYFGTRVHSITKGYICTREFDRRTKFPKQLCVEIHATNVNKDTSKKRPRPSTTRFYSEEDSGDEWFD
uniref:Demeter RRM-fold domain-containing protein n=1 Tax=Oryza punctata TaxID=4537 RepID=A0A0E0KPE0_ORYPU